MMAAEQGHARAMYDLAFLYYRGRGVSERPDFVRAHAWFGLAAERGVGDAGAWRDKASRKLSRKEREEAQRLALELVGGGGN